MERLTSASVELIAHACILIRVGDLRILCDPWLFGRAFNNGWGLSPKPEVVDSVLSEVTHLWISHEHPDHLHFPSLKGLTETLDLDRVTVLFQETNSDKVFDALKKLGYRRFKAMRHLLPIELDAHTQVFVYGHRHLDSTLGVILDGDNWLLNINDTELNERDCEIIGKHFGAFPLLFNQFSIAGFDGVLDKAQLERQKTGILDKMVAHHRSFRAQHTVPFASFMYFCRGDNAELNAFRNTVFDVDRTFRDNDLSALVMQPGGPALDWDLTAKRAINGDEIHQAGLAFFGDYYEREDREIDETEPPVPLDKIDEAFAARVGRWKKETFGYLFGKLGRVTCFIGDLNKGVTLDFSTQRVVEQSEVTQESAELLINSQPLHYAFSMPFGVQTLGVSGRYRFRGAIPRNWKLVRIVSSLANSDLYIGLPTMLRAGTYRWIWQRRRGLLSQVRQQMKRFFP